jgi:hypothetical protein
MCSASATVTKDRVQHHLTKDHVFSTSYSN